MNKLKKIYKENKQFINYTLVSLFCTGILYGLYFSITYLTKGHYIIANFVGYAVSFTVLYILDRKIFEAFLTTRKEKIKQINNFILYRIIGFIIESLILVFLIEKLLIVNAISKLISSLITFIYNYYTNKLFVFKNNKTL